MEDEGALLVEMFMDDFLEWLPRFLSFFARSGDKLELLPTRLRF